MAAIPNGPGDQRPPRRMASVRFQVETPGTVINVWWPTAGPTGSGAWYVAEVEAMTENGTPCRYRDGTRVYHDLFEERYVVLERPTLPSATKRETRESLIRKELECPICLSELQEPMTVKDCMHTFCNKCLWTQLQSAKDKFCACCKRPVNSMRDAAPNVTLQNILAVISEHPPEVSPATTLPVKEKKKFFACKMCGGTKRYKAQKCQGFCDANL